MDSSTKGGSTVFNSCTLRDCDGDEDAASKLLQACEAVASGDLEVGAHQFDGRWFEIRDNGTYRVLNTIAEWASVQAP